MGSDSGSHGHCEQAWTLYGDNKFAEAAAEFEKCITVSGDDAEAYRAGVGRSESRRNRTKPGRNFKDR
jgi:hypothetical protein